MAPTKDKWIRRFIIPETARHKKGFTIYKVTSMVFLSSSHEEISKVSVWKRYNDFKKLHSELSNLHKHLGIKESFPTFPKSKYFGRFEVEVVEERRKYALKFLEFIGRYSYLYSSDIFITFFETSHVDNCNSDYAHSISSDTSEEDRIIALNNSVLTSDTTAQSTLQVPCLSKTSHNVLTNPCSILSNICTNENEFAVSQRISESHSTTNLQNTSINDEQSYKMMKQYKQDTTNQDCDAHIKNTNLDRNRVTLNDESGFDCLNNNISKDLSNCNTTHSICSVTQADSAQYILIAAGHMSAAFKHESIAEYKEAFTQYKLGISSLITGVQFDPDSTRAASIKDKISKYLARAEQLYNRHLNCNISLVSKPVSELQYYKVLKIMKSVMLATDIRANCNRIIKSIEKSSIHEDNINNYVLREQVPYMVDLYGCVETETTVFLILQYASCGKLLDFVKLHYQTSNSLISNHTCTNNCVSNKLDSNKITHEQNNADKTIENDTYTKSQGKDLYSINGQEIYNMEVPTIQLLEKSQKLLQSVNATLRKSNSIASRLNKSKELKYSENVSPMNAKIITQISRDSDFKTNNDTESTSETNALNINRNINVNNRSTSNNDSIYETQYSHVYKENADENQELWQVPEAIIRSWAAKILLALEALHQQGVFIFDFKPDNILIDDMGHIKLTYIVPQHNVELSKLTYPYSSPEAATFSPIILVTSATDIWSFGVILYELLTGITFAVKHPGLFHSHSAISIPNKLSENARTLLHGILKYHPDERLTINEIKCHPFFADIDWSSMVNSQT